MAAEQEDTKTEEIEEKTEDLQKKETQNDVDTADLPEDAMQDNGTPDTDDVDAEALKQEIEGLRQELEENNDQVLRIRAEMDNLRKRTSRDIENAHKFALDKFVRELLPVIDSMELGINASDSVDDIESLREGMDLTLKKFIGILDKFGVSVIEAQGEKFDPEIHEAVSMQEMPDAESGTVITVMQKGYTLNGRLVRPAMVIVAK